MFGSLANLVFLKNLVFLVFITKPILSNLSITSVAASVYFGRTERKVDQILKGLNWSENVLLLALL
jgi:hypothetical protein